MDDLDYEYEERFMIEPIECENCGGRAVLDYFDGEYIGGFCLDCGNEW